MSPRTSSNNESDAARIDRLHWLKLQVTTQFLENALLPGYKGSLWHGAFGLALHEVDPLAYGALYGDQSPGELSRPYVLLPPLQSEEFIPAGAELTCELTLIGTACDQVSSCLQAFDRLGELGMGKHRSQCRVTHARAVGRETTESDVHASVALSSPVPLSAADVLAQPATPAEALAIFCRTPLRLKADGRLLHRPPSMELLVARLAGRLNALSVRDDIILVTAERREELLGHARAIELDTARVAWADWERYSGRQRDTMPFGGLVGTLFYRGDVGPLLPWLRLGEALHIGSKTTFGLGNIALHY